MNASPRPRSRTVRRGLHGVICVAAVLGHAAIGLAQTAPAEPPQVEMYVGVRRVYPPDPVQPVPSQTAQPTPTAPSAAAAPPVRVDIHLPPVPYEPSPSTNPVVQAVAVTGDPAPARAAPVERPAAPSTQTASPAAPAAPPSLSAPQPMLMDLPDARGNARPAPPGRRADSDSWFGAAAAQFAGTLAALALAALLYGCDRVLRGRRRRSFGGQTAVRVELVNMPASVLAAAPAPPAPPAPAPAPPPALPAAEPPPPEAAAPPEPRPEETLIAEAEKKFDLGPSYEDERRAAEEARQRAVDAILQQLVQQNVALRRQRAAQAAAA